MEMRSARAVIVIRVPQVGFEKESEPHLDMQHFFGIYQTAVGSVRAGRNARNHRYLMQHIREQAQLSLRCMLS